ncbi:MAG: nicotinate-nucleotide adenylyltransferase [Gammaproteobacteria bacterium]|jgi:nicotinate-nucleotide adenylyltransferase
MNERIGIMGGMFDPVHVGHIRVALAALRMLQLDHLRLVPCGVPNHRDRALCSSLQRLDMLRLAASGHPGLIVDDRELNRPGTSYTYDTLQSLRAEFEQAELFFILGVDAFASLDKWYRWRELFDLCHFVVIERPGYPVQPSGALRDMLQSRRVSGPGSARGRKSGLIFDLDGLDSPISSSQVRKRIANDEPLNDLLDPRVASYLGQHQLYKKAVTD